MYVCMFVCVCVYLYECINVTCVCVYIYVAMCI